MSTIQDPRWLATGTCSQFGGRCHLWGREWGSPLPSGSGCPHLPLCLWQGGGGWGGGLYAAGPLSFGVRSILCSVSVPGCALEPFAEKFSLALSLSFFFFVSLVIPQFGLLSQFSSLRLSSGHSGPVLSLRTDDIACASVPSHARWCWTRASGILLCWQLWLGVYSVLFFFFPSSSYVAH